MTPWIFALQPLKKRLGLQAGALLDLLLDGIPHLPEGVLTSPPRAFLLQFAGQPFQAQVLSRRGWVHPRLRRCDLLILLRVRQLSQPPDLLVRDHLVAPHRRDPRWSHLVVVEQEL
jgi:hypothetical protein